MLSQNQVKHIAALKVKKYREEFSQFIAEGHKLVMDLINSDFVITGIYASSDWIIANLPLIRKKEIPVFETLPREMMRISALSTPSPVLAVVNIPLESQSIHQNISTSAHQHINTLIHQHISPSAHQHISALILALDDIRDPGNLGTIIRIADWFGIDTILCSESCVDEYNPKVVQATMGSIARVRMMRCNLLKTITDVSRAFYLSTSGTLSDSGIIFPVYGTLLEGESIYSQTLTDHGIILIGNESRGISEELIPLVTKKIFIPFYGNALSGKAESLNASIAAAIVCAEFRRQLIKIEN